MHKQVHVEEVVQSILFGNIFIRVPKNINNDSHTTTATNHDNSGCLLKQNLSAINKPFITGI